ncbi:MAG: 3-methyladenine DNA glycosylase/8-oxoguanine DNA glycosylase [Flavobacteriales bacterium]|jgi:3-methyladenine DNA glycosylase/8-oxoguanine DNA glycosylase
MFSLGRSDVFPGGDLAIRKAMAILYELPSDKPQNEYVKIAKYRAHYKSVSCLCLWKNLQRSTLYQAQMRSKLHDLQYF